MAGLRPLAGVAVGLLMAEVLLRLFAVLPVTRQVVQLQFGPEGNRVAWFQDWLRLGSDSMLRAHPVRGWANPGRPVAFGDWSATLDEAGHRQPEVAPGASPSGPRVLVVGDSFAFGWDNNDDTTWQSGLLRRRPELTVRNAGVVGYDLGQMWLTWREEAPAFGPQIGVIFVQPHNATRSMEDFTLFARPIWPIELGATEPVNLPIGDHAAQGRSILVRPFLGMLLHMVWWHRSYGSIGDTVGAAVRGPALLKGMVTEMQEQGVTPVVLWVGTPSEVREVALGRRPDAWMPRCVDVPGVVCLNTVPALLDLQRQGIAVERGTHWSPAANEAVAGVLADWIAARP